MRKPMAAEDRVLAGGARYIDFQTDPQRYRHWKLDVDGDVATLTMDVDENGGLFEGYQLKLNSYDLGVDIELADAVQRLRFEHPAIKVVLLRSGKNRVFCAGANIRMLAGATHAHKVNFCKFTNETRNGLEDSSENSGQRFITVVNGTAAGGGYELALATDHIILADDGAAAVALPEVPLLAVLPGTGGLTRVVDKRKVRRDHADFFCTIEEGIKGKRAVAWRLVDEIVPNSKLDVIERGRGFAEMALLLDRSGLGVALDHDQAAQRGAIFARHFLPGRFAKMLAERDDAIFFLGREKDAPAIFRHPDIVELGPAARIDRIGGAQIDQRLLEAFGPHVAPPIHVAGMPAFEGFEHLPILAEIHVVGNLGGVIDVHDVHGGLSRVGANLVWRMASSEWKRKATRYSPFATRLLNSRHIELRLL